MIITSQLSDTQIPDISVIIPTYNRISMLEEALASVFSQDFDGIVEIFVVDDNSSDGTSEIVSEKYPNIRLISLKQNVGAYVARNLALKEARGKYIAFLDSDDLWKQNYLKVQVEALENRARCFAVSSLEIWNISKNRRFIKLQKPDLDKYMSPIHQLLVFGSALINTPSSVVFPCSVFDEVGLFEERFRVGVDIDLYLRCLAADFKILFTEFPVAIKRNGSKDQLTNIKNLKLRENIIFARIDKFYSSYNRSFDEVPPRRYIYAQNYLSLAKYYFKNDYILNGLSSCLAAAYNGSPVNAFSCVKKGLKFQLKNNVLKPTRQFFSDAF